MSPFTPETEQVGAWLEELRAGEWLDLEGGYLLIRNALRFEPTFAP